MGGDNERRSRPTGKLDAAEMTRLLAESRQHAEDTAEPAEVSFADLDDSEPKPEVSLMSRAKTLHDPLTTSLLAEVARRSQTMELSPEQVLEAEAVAEQVDHDEDSEPTPRPVSRRR